MTKRRVSLAATALVVLGIALYFGGRPARHASAPTELTALRQELRRLQDEFETLSMRSPDSAFATAPTQGLVIGVPVDVARDVARQTTAGFLGSVSLTLRGQRVRKSAEVEAEVLFARRTVGSYELDAQVLVARATLRPQGLQFSFAGGRMGFDVPVATSGGRGRVRLRLSWRSEGLASLVCGDVDATRDLEGRILPAVYPMSGSFEIVAEAGRLVLRPHFSRLSIRVQLEATPQAWRAFDELLAQQGRLCREAFERANVRRQLAKVLEAGFTVELPRGLLRDITLPVSVQQSLSLQDDSFVLEIKPAEVVVTAQTIWYGADVTIERDPGP